MKCLVTGATGFIGNNLVRELINRNYEVGVLVRIKNKIPSDLINKITVTEGKISDLNAIEVALRNCDFVFHLAAYANIWSKDKMLAFNTNVIGTRNILSAALKNGVKKIVFTSTAGTFPPTANGEEVDETFPIPEHYYTEYESTKQQAEQLCKGYYREGLDIVIVNPSRVYGPGLLNKSNSVTILIKKYIEGKWRLIPGNGNQIGNYVFIDDVVNGHILALEKGKSGEKYILSGTNISYNGFFEKLAKVNGKKYRMVHFPFFLMQWVSKFELFMAETFGKPPLITPAWTKRYLQDRLLSGKKAIHEIDYTVTPLEEGLLKTINWLNTNKKLWKIHRQNSIH